MKSGMKDQWHCLQVFVCTDLWKDRGILHRAYCDAKGVTEAFIKNGLENAVREISYGAVQISSDDWKYEVVINDVKTQVSGETNPLIEDSCP